MYKCFFILLTILLSGCSVDFLSTGGVIATEEHKLIFISFILMLFVVLPVIFMTIFFVFRYKANKNSVYLPNWNKSNIIELIIWIIPIFIIFFLALITWRTTHKLDPSRIIGNKNNYLEIHVIALDWKWLFIYPKYSVGIVNKVIIPLNTTILFRVTSNSVMNSFFIPNLGSQIYAMPGMSTKLYLIASKPGIYHGISSNYSGIGFSNMKFITYVEPTHESFLKCVNFIKKSKFKINTMFDFEELALPTTNHFIKYYSYVNSNTFFQIINKFKNY
ncbi:ubiquinol oxidase subunit II [Candidatus Purcelliella pentastirinorum]|uniref:Ubiquinol oxidase subunit 2 n=1 Tax=Candidatus Purcelliella pentastirinorum TaxID=472834 RepID=A0AAX3N6Y3_9ENTR|nr:ubiquinol oxidase subunit II [Candidatus Purcelliella pentastirinorum]WDI78339.1 ubiquinol oxidase subunit II [Candidatus Purcelliella pentastirinorum]